MQAIAFVKQFNEFRKEDLERLESKFSISLPPDYVQFLETYNGGFLPQPYFALTEEGIFGICSFFGLADENENLFNQTERFTSLPDNKLPIARDWGGNYLLLSLDEAGYGGISIWYHDSEHENEDPADPQTWFRDVEPVADSFAELIDELYPDEARLEEMLQEEEDADEMEELISEGYSVDQPYASGQSFLTKAILAGNLTMLELMVNEEIDKDALLDFMNEHSKEIGETAKAFVAENLLQ